MPENSGKTNRLSILDITDFEDQTSPINQPQNNNKPLALLPNTSGSATHRSLHSQLIRPASTASPSTNMTVPLPGPDAAQRLDPADHKIHLHSFGYWKLSTDEQTWAVFRNTGGPNKTATEHKRIELAHQAVADDFYKRFKKIVVVNLTLDDGFCGGAFKEKVNQNSPFTDIMTFVIASPVICKEHKTIFKTLIAKLYYNIISSLRTENPKTQETYDQAWWKLFEKWFAPIAQAFKNIRAQKDFMALPDDISDAWLEEFGPVFTANYKKAQAGDPTAPFKVVKCVRDRFGLSKLCICFWKRSANLYGRYPWLWPRAKPI